MVDKINAIIEGKIVYISEDSKTPKGNDQRTISLMTQPKKGKPDTIHIRQYGKKNGEKEGAVVAMPVQIGFFTSKKGITQLDFVSFGAEK